MIDLTILIPVYNEEATILEILGHVAEQKIDGVRTEVFVVDDGSTDRTVELLEQNPDLYAKLIKRPQNGGKGAAVRAGLKEASGDYVLFQDADLEYDPAEYAKLLMPVLKFDADIVMGSRLVASPAVRPVAIGWFVVRILGRYALLAGIAYVTIARLHLPPLALLAGVSAIVVGVALEGFRALVGRHAAS